MFDRSRDGPLSQKQATNLNLGGRADTAKVNRRRIQSTHARGVTGSWRNYE